MASVIQLNFLIRSRLLLCALLVSTLTCARRPAIPDDAPIIIISIDTLRSDRLPAYGYRNVETPAIDAFRADSILFARAYAPCPLTLVSHASTFTGLLPADHGIRDNIGFTLDPKAKTLAEHLKSRGYVTGGAVSSVVLRRDTGINRGFDFWSDDVEVDPSLLTLGGAQRRGDITRVLAEKWIAEQTKPFLFFLHIYEPHTPYEPPEPFRSTYGASYDGEVAAADAIVGRFLQQLRQKGIYDRATIVLMSDHGEGLGDHGEDEHGVLLYREALQIPLILKLPGQQQKGTRVDTPVQLNDVLPTLVPGTADARSGGRSLIETVGTKGGDDRRLYAETFYPRLHFGWSDLHSIISGDQHYVHGPKPELYDLRIDPGEQKNTLAENRRVYAALRQQIQPLIQIPAAPQPVDEERRRQLTALGYLGSTVTTEAGEILPDPKENIGKIREIAEIFRAFREQRFESVISMTTKLLDANRQMLDLWTMKSGALEKLGRLDEAIDTAKEGLRVSPQSTPLALMTANLGLQARRFEEAVAHARLALPRPEAHLLLAEIALAQKDYAGARTAITAIHQPSENAAALLLLGRIAAAEGNLNDALTRFDAAATHLASRRQSLPKLHFHRGDALVNLGRDAEAEVAFRKEIELFPADPAAYKNLIILLTLQSRAQEATELIFGLEKAAPTPPSYLAIAEVLRVIGDQRGARYWAARGFSKFPQSRELKKAAG